jgi:hypothetical protein
VSLALFKLGRFITIGLEELLGYEIADSGSWQSNPITVMVIGYSLLSVIKLKGPRRFWLIAGVVAGNIAYWVIQAVLVGDSLKLGPVMVTIVGGMLAIAVLVIVDPLLPKEGIRVDPDDPDSNQAACS